MLGDVAGRKPNQTVHQTQHSRDEWVQPHGRDRRVATSSGDIVNKTQIEIQTKERK